MISVPQKVSREHELIGCLSIIEIEGKVPGIFGEKNKKLHVGKQIDIENQNYQIDENYIKNMVAEEIGNDKRARKVTDGVVDVSVYGLYKNAEETFYKGKYKIQNGHLM